MNKIYKYTFLLIALLTVVPALAQTDPMVTETDNLWMKKTVKDNENGTYTLNLQTYVKGSGQITTTTSIKPADVAMVLDFSSSMASNTITMNVDKEYKERLQTGSTINTSCTNEVYMVVKDRKTYYGKLFKNSNRYYIPLKSGSVPTSYNDCTDNQYLISRTQASGVVAYTIKDSDEVYLYCSSGQNKTISRLMGLQIACSNFVETLLSNPPTGEYAGENHKISIMPFSSAGASTTAQTLTDLTNETYKSMENLIGNTAYAQGTRADLGMEEARKMFANLPTGEDRNRIVVFFTDGVPTTSGSAATDFNPTYGKDVVNTAYTIKHDLNATIYSVALFKSNFETKYIRRYMHWTSSNYPGKQITAVAGTEIGDDNIFNGSGDMTTSTTPADGLEAPHDYYLLSTGNNLTDVFVKIAEESTSGNANIKIDANSAVVLDVISNKFRLPAGTEAKDIKLYTCDVKSDNTGSTVVWKSGSHDGEDWVEWKPWTTTGKQITDYIHINNGVTGVETDNNYLEVTGYDFAENYVGPVKNETGTIQSWHGQKLIIEFVIETDPANEGGLTMATNDPTSGLYIKKTSGGTTTYEMASDGGEPAQFKQPTVNLPYIKIIKKGLKVGESALFRVTKVTEANSNVAVTDGTAYTADVIITRATESQNDGNAPYAILKLVYTGYYKVEELPWAWAYTHDTPKWGLLSTVDATSDTQFLTFTFINSTNSEAPEHAESFVPNNMSVSRSVGDPKTGSTEGGTSDDEIGGDEDDTDL